MKRSAHKWSHVLSFLILKYSPPASRIFIRSIHIRKGLWRQSEGSKKLCIVFFLGVFIEENTIYGRKRWCCLLLGLYRKKRRAKPQKILKYAARIMRLGYYNSTIIYIKMVSNGQFIIPALTKADRESSTNSHVVVDYSHSWPVRCLRTDDSYARIKL